MRRTALLAVLLAAVAVVGIAPGVAQADPPAKCPSEQSLMKSTSTYSRAGYLCAQEDHSGSMSIGAGKTHSYNTGTNDKYYPYYDCSDRTSSSVTIAHGLTFGSDSWTATNWLTPSNTRHWSAAVLWTIQGSGVSGLTKGCDVDAQTWTTPPVIYNRVFLTQSGLPMLSSTGNVPATAGKAYTITVSVSPTSWTGPIYLSDNGAYVADATAANGTAVLSWTPRELGTRAISIVAPAINGYAPGTVDTDPLSVYVGYGTGLQLTGVTDNGDGSSTATVVASGTTVAGPVTLLNVVENADGSITKTALGQATMTNGTIGVAFRPASGTAYTLVAVLGNPAVAQTYPYAYPSAKRLEATGGVLGTALDALPARGAVATGVTSVTRTQRVTAARSPLVARCPSGTHAINADAATSGPVDDVRIAAYSSQHVEAVAPVQSIGHTLLAQVLCRANGQRATISGRVGYGTIGHDVLTATQSHVVLFGGPGRDRLTGKQAHDALWGGLGRDLLLVHGASSVADGGPGHDVLIGIGTQRQLLVGGRGRDIIVGPFGPGYLNAQDGEGGDTVTCRDPRTRVLRDPGDIVIGPCRVIDG